MTASRSVPGISIVTPDDWAEFDLDPATRHRSVVRAVRRACTRDHSLSTLPLITLLDDLMSHASAAGGFYLSAIAGRGDAELPFASSVFMQLGPPRGFHPDTPAQACAGYASGIAADVGRTCDV